MNFYLIPKKSYIDNNRKKCHTCSITRYVCLSTSKKNVVSDSGRDPGIIPWYPGIIGLSHFPVRKHLHISAPR